MSQGYTDLRDDPSKGRGKRSGSQGKACDGKVQESDETVQGTEAQMKVAGSFFHVDGVGLLDENLVRSNPWVLDQRSARAMQMSHASAALLSTQPQNVAAPADACSASPVLSTAPVCGPHLSFARVPQVLPAGAGVVIDGLMTSAHFNGLHGIIESYDAETNRYNVQLPLVDSTVLLCRGLARGHTIPSSPDSFTK